MQTEINGLLPKQADQTYIELEMRVRDCFVSSLEQIELVLSTQSVGGRKDWLGVLASRYRYEVNKGKP